MLACEKKNDALYILCSIGDLALSLAGHIVPTVLKISQCIQTPGNHFKITIDADIFW